jgi:hypothetical protein
LAKRTDFNNSLSSDESQLPIAGFTLSQRLSNRVSNGSYLVEPMVNVSYSFVSRLRQVRMTAASVIPKITPNEFPPSEIVFHDAISSLKAV